MPGSPAFISAVFVNAQGLPLANAECVFLADPTSPQDPIFASFEPITVFTDSSGNLSSNIGGLPIWPGTYRLRVNGLDVFRFTVPNDGALHSLTSLLSL